MLVTRLREGGGDVSKTSDGLCTDKEMPYSGSLTIRRSALQVKSHALALEKRSIRSLLGTSLLRFRFDRNKANYEYVLVGSKME